MNYVAFRSGQRTYHSWQILLIILILSAIIGAWLGELIRFYIPAIKMLGTDYPLGIPRFTLDLRVLSLTFGFTLRLNLFSLLGMIGGFFVYRRM